MPKATDHFKNTIKAYMDDRAKQDKLFAVSYAKENKNIDGCISYILDTVHKSGCSGFNDDEIYSMAVHYYDEDNIKTGKLKSCKVVINHQVELTEDEKANARKVAIEKLEKEIYEDLKRKPRKKKEDTNVQQMTLF